MASGLHWTGHARRLCAGLLMAAIAPAGLPQTCPPEFVTTPGTVIEDDCLIEIRPNAARLTPPFTDAANLPVILARVEGQLLPPWERVWGAAWVISPGSPLNNQRIFLFGNGLLERDQARVEPYLLWQADNPGADPRAGGPLSGQGGYGAVRFVSCPPLIS